MAEKGVRRGEKMTDTGERIQDRNEKRKRVRRGRRRRGRRTESIFVARYDKRFRSWARCRKSRKFTMTGGAAYWRHEYEEGVALLSGRK